MNANDCQAVFVKMDDLESKIATNFAQVATLDEECKKAKNEDIKSMIRHYIALSDKIEDRRIRIYTIGLQVLTISLTVLGLVLTRYENPTRDPLMVTVLLSIATLGLSAFFVGIVFHFQSGFRYPFLSLKGYANQWKWFYYGNPEVSKIQANPIRHYLKSKMPRINLTPIRRWFEAADNCDRMHYLAGLEYYSHQYGEEDLDREIKQNIVQLYLLQVHNYYKNRFERQLTNIWKFAFTAVPLIWLFYVSGLVTMFLNIVDC